MTRPEKETLIKWGWNINDVVQLEHLFCEYCFHMRWHEREPIDNRLICFGCYRIQEPPIRIELTPLVEYVFSESEK